MPPKALDTYSVRELIGGKSEGDTMNSQGPLRDLRPILVMCGRYK